MGGKSIKGYERVRGVSATGHEDLAAKNGRERGLPRGNGPCFARPSPLRVGTQAPDTSINPPPPDGSSLRLQKREASKVQVHSKAGNTID